MDQCVNCGIATNRCNTLGRRALDNETILSVIRQWRAPQPVNSSDHVCNACWNLAQRPSDEQQLGHRNVCLRCGRSLASRVRHLLHNNSIRETRIYNVIREWIIPRTVQADSHICHACWVAADRAAVHMVSGPSTLSQGIPLVAADRAADNMVSGPSTLSQGRPLVAADRAADNMVSGPSTLSQGRPLVAADRAADNMVSGPSTLSQGRPLVEIRTQSPALPLSQTSHEENEPEPTIVLPEYMRAIETQSRCFIVGCQRTERYRVPISTRKMLLSRYKYYIPENNRLCDRHLVIEGWDFLDSLTSNYVRTFTAKHIQDMMTLKDVTSSGLLQFENLGVMEDHVVHTWLGVNNAQFNALLAELPQILELPRGSLALIAYLMKLRTGEPDERLATLLKVSKRTFDKWLHQVRDLLTVHLVPRYLGLHHISRAEIIERNLLIPNTLFGALDGRNMPIVIFDGTYCYIQKSSNYLFQKRTYSMHKYRNLIKPFLLVTTDGYIIDVLGPYPATTSDADIMKSEFSAEGSLREYFQEENVFILDRGFRDALPLLHQCGHRTHVPASLEEGETQLSTIEANKSRAVTLCRWVVEVVNGRFKRDFKLLRQNYSNVASKTFMVDFKVAAALLNKFHPCIVDRVDAGEIIEQINIYMNRENDLAEFIITNNYNRRRANFEEITVENDNLNDFPQLSQSELILISLGTYQIKQARSYFGEHVRFNEGFVIEVCREFSSSLIRELSASNTSWLLRGRIQSRHISRKTYFVYIFIDGSRRGRGAILQYYCNCIVGRRTVGCCAHVMSIIWYLSWARYQDNVVPPAQFLDDILIIIENE